MKKLIISILVVFALCAAGCSLSTGASDMVDDALVAVPEGDFTSPFEIGATGEADEDVTDDVVVDDGDEVAFDDGDGPVETGSEGIFEMQTDADDIDTDAEVGTHYEQAFRMVDKDRDYSWSVSGLPEGSGLSLEVVTESWRYKLHGTPSGADLGTHEITVEVVDADSNSTSITFELSVVSNIPDFEFNENSQDPCSKPLRIVVENFAGHVDHKVLGDGVFNAKVGSDVSMRFRAVRGYPVKTVDGEEGTVPPVGEVKWSWTHRVKDSYHCHRIPRDNGQNDGWGGGDMSLQKDETYQYTWVEPETDCTGTSATGGAYEVEGKYTRNATWRTRTGDVVSDVLEIDGQMLYDGPLPVRELPVDEDAVELIDVTVTDGCAANNGGKGTHRTIEIGIRYPVVGWDAEGGRLSDVEVDMDFGKVSHYWKGSDGACDDGGYDGYEDVCGMNSKLVMIFTNEEGLSESALNSLEDTWQPHKAIEESLGYIAYDFKACDQDDDNCDDRKVTIVDNQSDDLNAVQRVYLLWSSPSYTVPKVGDHKRRQLDFDIEDIEFKTDYWSAEYEDDDDVFGNNLIPKYGAVRSDLLTNLEGMSPANSNGGIFRRRELAAYILNHQQPEQY